MKESVNGLDPIFHEQTLLGKVDRGKEIGQRDEKDSGNEAGVTDDGIMLGSLAWCGSANCGGGDSSTSRAIIIFIAVLLILLEY